MGIELTACYPTQVSDAVLDACLAQDPASKVGSCLMLAT